MRRSIRTVGASKPAGKKVSHPTRERLLETVLLMMQNKRPEEITADEVLERSGISRGSLYYHFDDFADLVETALVHVFARTVDKSIERIAEALASRSKPELVKRLRKVTAATQAPELRGIRIQRAKLIAFAEGRPRFEARLSVEQNRLTDAIADIVRELQHRKWIPKENDAIAIAVLIQAYTLGRIVDDIGEPRVDPAAWQRLINRVAEKALLGE